MCDYVRRGRTGHAYIFNSITIKYSDRETGLPKSFDQRRHSINVYASGQPSSAAGRRQPGLYNNNKVHPLDVGTYSNNNNNNIMTK